MNLKYFKNIFICIIIILIILGIYIIYIKDNKKQSKITPKNSNIKTTKEIILGITNFDIVNPILTKNLEIQHITKLIYEPLINITQDFNVEPCIAEEWSKINDLTYIIKLDENKQFHNSEKITIEDIQFTIKTILESDTIYKENVKQIENIEKINETTFKIYLKKPVNFFEYLLCFPILEELTYNSENPIGTGEYKITQITNNQIIIQGKETKLIIKIYNNTTELYNNLAKGNIDIIITQNTNYKQYIGNIGLEEHIITGREFYYISCENITDIETRKYINNIINKEKLIYDLYNSKYVTVDFPLQYGSYLNKEKNILHEIKTKKLTNITLSTNSENNQIANELKKQLEENKIEINIQNYENLHSDLILKKDLIHLTPDIKKYFKNENIKQEIDKILKIENKEILRNKYEEIIEKYYEEQPFISLFFNSYIILHTDKLKGNFSGNWYNMFYNIDTWYKIL